MKKAVCYTDIHYPVGNVDDKMFSSFTEHLGRCIYSGIYEPGHPLADEDGFRTDVMDLVKELKDSGAKFTKVTSADKPIESFLLGWVLPLVIFYLSVLHVVPYRTFREQWRIIYVGLLTMVAMITPDGSPVTTPQPME